MAGSAGKAAVIAGRICHRSHPSAGTLLHLVLFTFALSTALLGPASAQTCQNAGDIEPATRATLEAAAHRYFQMSARGDTSALKQASIPALADSFGGVESAVRDNQAALARSKPQVRASFLLTTDAPQPIARAEFLCGVFGASGQTRDSAVFVLHNLPQGKYGVIILDLTSDQDALTLTFILQSAGADWKLAGFYAKYARASGHDATWFTERARQFKARSQNHNAWLYYREAVGLSSPVDFMSTLATDKLYEEMQTVLPADMPTDENAIDWNAGGKTYRWTQIAPLSVGGDLDIKVTYDSADVSNTTRTFQENTAVIRALIAKFPELRAAFTAVEAQAVDPSGHDFSSLLAIKDIP